MNRDSPRWTARQKARLVRQLARGEKTIAEACREHGLTQSEVEGWMKAPPRAGARGMRARGGDDRAAAALGQDHRPLQDILDHTTAVIYLKDTEGRYLLVNAKYEALFHVRRDQVVGKTDYDFFPREAADAFRANDRQVLAADRAIDFDEFVPHDDGMHTYISVKFPLRDTRGRPYGVCGISTDITLRKEMEARLRASRAQLTALIENTTDAIWSVDRDYRVTAFNSVVARWFENTYGKPLTEGDPIDVHPVAEERDHWRLLYDRALAGERLVFERDYPAPEGPQTFMMSLTPIVTQDRITGVTVFARDLTDLKRAEERAHHHLAALTHMQRVSTAGEIAASLAHEINQPLAAIANYTLGCRLRILSGSARPDELMAAVEKIASQAQRASDIVQQLRRLVESGESTRTELGINDIVAEAVDVMLPQARHQGIVLSVQLAPGLPRVRVDPIQIGQVVMNLLMNGFEAMEPTGAATETLSVHTAPADDGGVEVVVRDTGIGLTPQARERMFEPFFTTKPSGLGMGLAISRSIVEKHGGRIWGASDADRGSAFHVVLPGAGTGGGDNPGPVRAGPT